MGKSAPSAPDPIKTASGQTATNIGTAIANSYLGNVNQVTPYGSLNYAQTGTQKWTDPLSDKTYDLPTFTATQTLTPTGQRISDATMGAQENLANLAQSQSARLGNLLGTEINLSGLPAAAQAPQLAQGIAGAGQIQTVGNGPRLNGQIGDAGQITTSYGGNYAQDRRRVEDAIMQRAQRGLDADRRALEQRLADQGIAIGSAAYQSAMGDYGQQVNDARTQAILAGGQEQSRLNDMAAQRAAFENAAQAQQFGQNLQGIQLGNTTAQQMYQNRMGAAEFNNAAQAQRFGQNAQQAGFANTAAQQQYQLGTDARNRALQELFAVRNQPINEISALLSGAQVQQPNFMNVQGQQMPTVDYAGLVNQKYQGDLARYNSQQQLFGGLMGGLAYVLSDERAKTDIEKVGKTKDGQAVYAYRYKHEGKDGPIHMGLMAQEVEKRKPEAVATGPDGLKRVNYGIALGV